MIQTPEDFDNRLRSCIAPIYFYDKNSYGTNEVSNGTVTLYKEDFKVFGITNYHVYKEYLKRKSVNNNTVCQIGYELKIELEQRVYFEEEKYDLVVFVLYEEELEKIGGPSNPKSGFRYINTDIEILLQDQKYEDPNTWAIHIAGFPGGDKITQKINCKKIQLNFGIVFFSLFAKYFPDPMDNNGGPKISFDFGETSKAINNGYLKADIGQLSEKSLVLGGISGCPVFARCVPNQDDFTLLGIVYEGPSDQDSVLPEIIYARPVSLIEEILKGQK